MAIDIDQEWLTLQEASKITGKRPSALRGAIQRRKVSKIKKETGAIGDYWLIHRDELGKLGNTRSGVIGGDRSREIDGGDPAIEDDRSEAIDGGDRVNLITVEYYDHQRDKWDRERSHLEQGLMMYRYKFEELDKKVKLLPAPVELVNEELKQRDLLLERAKRVILEEKNKISQMESHIKEKSEALEAEVDYRNKLASSLQEKEEAIQEHTSLLHEAQKIIEQATASRKEQEAALVELRKKLEEEEKAKAELRAEWEKAVSELQKPWWKKLFGIK